MIRGALLFLALVLGSGALAADKPQSLEQMRAAADAAEGERCTRECLDFARRLVEESDRLFTAGDVTQGHAMMDEAVKYARKATDASISSRKKQKNTEIALRKMSKRISDIGETLNVDDRPGIKKNIDDLESMRSALLQAMFGLDSKEMKK